MTIRTPASPSRGAPRRLRRPSPARTPGPDGIGKEDRAGSMRRLLLRARRVARGNDRDVPASLAALISRPRDRTLDRAIAFDDAQPPPEDAAAKSAEPAAISRAGSGTARRDPRASSTTRVFRSPATRRNAISERASRAGRSREASARRRAPMTSPACAPSSPPPESGAGTSPEPWRVPSRCNRSRNRASETRRLASGRPTKPDPGSCRSRRNAPTSRGCNECGIAAHWVMMQPCFTRTCERAARKPLPEESRRDPETSIVSAPGAAPIVRGTGGIRKLRWAGSGRGKRGGIRAIRSCHAGAEAVYLLAAYAKADRDDLTPADRRALSRLVAAIKKGRTEE